MHRCSAPEARPILEPFVEYGDARMLVAFGVITGWRLISTVFAVLHVVTIGMAVSLVSSVFADETAKLPMDCLNAGHTVGTSMVSGF